MQVVIEALGQIGRAASDRARQKHAKLRAARNFGCGSSPVGADG
jgi:hypothetical protein